MKAKEVPDWEGKEIIVGDLSSWRSKFIARVDSYGWSRSTSKFSSDRDQPIRKGTGTYVAVDIVGEVTYDGRIVRFKPEHYSYGRRAVTLGHCHAITPRKYAAEVANRRRESRKNDLRLRTETALRHQRLDEIVRQIKEATGSTSVYRTDTGIHLSEECALDVINHL